MCTKPAATDEERQRFLLDIKVFCNIKDAFCKHNGLIHLGFQSQNERATLLKSLNAMKDEVTRVESEVAKFAEEKPEPTPATPEALALEYGMAFLDPKELENIKAEILTQIPDEVARRYKVIPIHFTNRMVMVAIGDPTDLETLDSLRYILKREIEATVTCPEAIQKALDKYYPGPQIPLEVFLENIQADICGYPRLE